MHELPVETCKRLIRDTNPHMRVSKDAGSSLSEILEETAKTLSILAVIQAEKDKKKTIRAEHIKRAYKQFLLEDYKQYIPAEC